MDFEFDEAKSLANKAKHGIDFVEAQLVWRDSERIEIPAKDLGEPRSLVTGRIGVRLWSVVITMRGNHVRIISARRARDEEKSLYHSRGI